LQKKKNFQKNISREESHSREGRNFHFWMNYPFKVCGSVLTYVLFKDHLLETQMDSLLLICLLLA